AALEANDVQPREIRRVETIQVSLPLVESGAAWTILPDPDRRSLDRFRLTIRELDPMLPPLRALVLAKHAAAQHGATRHVLDIIANERRSNATHEHLHSRLQPREPDPSGVKDRAAAVLRSADRSRPSRWHNAR